MKVDPRAVIIFDAIIESIKHVDPPAASIPKITDTDLAFISVALNVFDRVMPFFVASISTEHQGQLKLKSAKLVASKIIAKPKKNGGAKKK